MPRSDVGYTSVQLSAPGSPSSGSNTLYPKSDDNWYSKNSSGVEVLVTNSAALNYHIGRTNAAGTTMATSGTAVSIPWATTVGSSTGFSYSSNVFTVTNAGRYILDCGLTWVTNTTGIRQVALYLNGSLYRSAQAGAGASGPAGAVLSTVMQLSAADTLEIRGLQTSGGSLALQAVAVGNYIDISYIGVT